MYGNWGGSPSSNCVYMGSIPTSDYLYNVILSEDVRESDNPLNLHILCKNEPIFVTDMMTRVRSPR